MRGLELEVVQGSRIGVTVRISAGAGLGEYPENNFGMIRIF